MKKLCKTFTVLGFVFALVGFFAVIILGISFVLWGAALIASAETITGAKPEDVESMRALGAMLGACGIMSFVFCPFLLVSTILTGIAMGSFKKAKCKKDLKKPAILNIIGGAFGVVFPLVAGILMLAVKPKSLGFKE